MTRRAGALNRFWIGVLGVVLLLAGVAALALSTGQAAPVVGDQLPLPSTQDPIVTVPTDAVSNPITLVIIGLAGLLLAVLGVAWLLAQLPRSGSADPYRISDDPAGGLTTVTARVLAGAVSDDVRSLPGVTSADAIVRGTAAAPELVLDVTARTDTDLAGLLDELRTGVPERFGLAVGAPVQHVGVRLDLQREQTAQDRMVVAPTAYGSAST